MEGRTALVTGGGQGVGQGIVRSLAQAGANLVIASAKSIRAKRKRHMSGDAFRDIGPVAMFLAGEPSGLSPATPSSWMADRR